VLNPSNHLPTSTSRHCHHLAIAFQTVRNLVPQSINPQPTFMLYLCLMYALSIDTRRVFFFYIEKLEKLEFAAG
jgi:hypothetical protein